MADNHAAVTALAAEALGVGVGPFGAAHVGSRYCKVLELERLDGGDEDLAGVDMVYGDVEEALDLVCMEVAGHDAVCSGGGEEVGDEFGADGHAGAVFPILPGPSEIGDDGDDLVCRGTLGGVYAQQKLHEVVCGRYGGLDDEHGGTADTLCIKGLEFPVAELADLEVSQMDGKLVWTQVCIDGLDDLAGEILGFPAGKNLHAVCVDHIRANLVLCLCS